jgi:hypothetical protein
MYEQNKIYWRTLEGRKNTNKIRIYIWKLLKDWGDLYKKCLYSLLETVLQHVEESIGDLSRYFSIIVENCKFAHISTKVKLDFHDLDELCHKNWNGEIH